MGKYKMNQTVSVRGSEIGVIVCKCKEPEGYWAVVLKKQNEPRTYIELIHEENIAPHVDYCWGCGYEPLVSSKHDTCLKCHWIVCPRCEACTKHGCKDDYLEISQK